MIDPKDAGDFGIAFAGYETTVSLITNSVLTWLGRGLCFCCYRTPKEEARWLAVFGDRIETIWRERDACSLFEPRPRQFRPNN